MPLFSFEGLTPTVHPTAFIAPTATLVGDVRVEAQEAGGREAGRRRSWSP